MKCAPCFTLCYVCNLASDNTNDVDDDILEVKAMSINL